MSRDLREVRKQLCEYLREEHSRESDRCKGPVAEVCLVYSGTARSPAERDKVGSVREGDISRLT